MDTFHPSLSTKTFNGTIYKKFDSFCFEGNFECPTCGSHNYWKQLENKQEMKHSKFMKWNNHIN